MGPKKAKKKKALFGDEDEEEEARKRAEEERLEQERIRMEMEKELKKMKKQKAREAAREKHEDELRTKILTANCAFFNDFLLSRKAKQVLDRKNEEWVQYSTCKVQPFPYDPPSLNTYLYAFHKNEITGEFLNINNECEKLIEILKRVDKYIDIPLELSDKVVRNLEEVKGSICKEILYKYDAATFQAIMNIDEYFSKVDIWKVEALNRSENFLFWIWGWAVGGNVERKKKKVYKDTMPKRITEDFYVRLPRRFKYKRLHLRVIRISYDVFSWRCSSYNHPQNVDNHDLAKEIKNIRDREITALKGHSLELDHEAMPWWYLQVYPVPLITKQKDAKATPSRESYKVAVAPVIDLEEEACEEEEDELLVSEPSVLDSSHRIFIINDDCLKKSECMKETSNEKMNTPILYSINNMNLRRGKRTFNGPVYYQEPEFLDFLADTSDTVSIVSSDSDIICRPEDSDSLSNKDNDNSDVDSNIVEKYFDIIKRARRKNSGPDSHFKIRCTSKRFFLDYRPFNPERSAKETEEALFDIIFRGKKTGIDILNELLSGGREKKTSQKLKTMRDFMNETVIKQTISVSDDHSVKEERRKSRKSIKAKTVLTKITTPDEMRMFDEEVSNILKEAKSHHSDFYTSKLLTVIEEGMLNLRVYSIIGGVYLIDFIHDEPQAVIDENGIKTQLHYGEYSIKKEPFFTIPVVHFDAALAAERQLSAARVSRQSSIRASIRQKQARASAAKDEVELEDDETIHIQLKVYDKAVWFSTPIPVIWDEESRYWTTKNVYDAEMKGNENKVFFKLGKTSVPLALASYRWHNLPYSKFHLIPSKNWETKPSVQFTLSGKSAALEFNIDENGILLVNIDRTIRAPFEHILGVRMPFYDLANALRKSNMDIFPEWDTFLYVNTSLKKSRPLEDHMYKCLAFVSSAYEITYSYWNQMADYTNIYLSIRQSVDDESKDFDCLRATALNTYYVRYDSSDFSIPIEPLDPHLGVQPDLKSLVETTASDSIKSRIRSVPSGLVENVLLMISGSKILSYT